MFNFSIFAEVCFLNTVCRLIRTILSIFGKPIGEDGIQINALLATQAWNLKKMM